MIWFTSDTHFGHENMLRLSDRPWSAVAQMNDAMVANINSKVAADDELYILGDFSFKMTVQDAYELRKSITCKRVHLLPGNHDKDWTQSAVADAFIVEPSSSKTSPRVRRRMGEVSDRRCVSPPCHNSMGRSAQ